MQFVDRLLTIIVTATLTSAAWIVLGGSLIENAQSEGQRDTTRPAEAAPSPRPLQNRSSDPGTGLATAPAKAALLQRDLPKQMDGKEARELIIPVLNVRKSDLSDTFTQSRAGGDRLHAAIDIMAPEGTSVVAAASGTIEKKFESETGGKTLYVRSSDRSTIHYYAHLDQYAQGIREGQRVRRGQRLGTVGSTGNADPESPHLHFEIMRTTPKAKWWEPSVPINPYPLLASE